MTSKRIRRREGRTDKTNPIKARTESSTSCFQFLVSTDCVSNARWKTWRAICVGEAEVWFWCGFAPRCCQLRDWVEVAARGGAAVGEGWTGRGWFFGSSLQFCCLLLVSVSSFWYLPGWASKFGSSTLEKTCSTDAIWGRTHLKDFELEANWQSRTRDLIYKWTRRSIIKQDANFSISVRSLWLLCLLFSFSEASTTLALGSQDTTNNYQMMSNLGLDRGSSCTSTEWTQIISSDCVLLLKDKSNTQQVPDGFLGHSQWRSVPVSRNKQVAKHSFN